MDYIWSRKILKDKVNDIPELKDIGKAAWSFVSSIYKYEWDSIYTDRYNNSFRNRISNKTTSKILKNNLSYNPNKSKNKVAEITRLSPPILVYIFKEILKKSKFFGKGKELITTAKTNIRQLYAQVVNLKITDILKLKEDYSNLPAKKIENIHWIINNASKSKPHIKMTTKGLL